MAIKNTWVGTSETQVTTTVAADKSNATVLLFFCNTTASAVTLTVYALPSGQTATSDYMILNEYSIAAKETFVFDSEKFILETGEKIAAIAGTASAIVATEIPVALKE